MVRLAKKNATTRSTKPGGETPLRLRAATLDDGRLLLAWRNDRETRRQSFNQAPVPWVSHRAWLTAKLADQRCQLHVALAGTAPVGQVRTERLSRSSAEVHIALAPQARGRGLASRVLELVARDARRSLGVALLVAHIRPDNVASVIAFVKAGFVFRRLTTIKDTRCYRLERTV
jgi:UDP-2,4-diacetamido-2,4,6-trideoxy-beta-L-altropyranose hydrolase